MIYFKIYCESSIKREREREREKTKVYKCIYESLRELMNP